jgi:GT2 family glycosyltransferase
MDDGEVKFESTKQGRLQTNGFSSVDPRYMSAVEIIIPFYGLYNRVSSLLESIFATVTRNRYQITLVDDGSPNEGFIKEISSKNSPGLVCMRMNENRGFASAINYAIQNRKHNWIPYICILHTDIVISDTNWLSGLGSTFKRLKTKGVKMVSARSNNFGDGLKHLDTTNSQKCDDVILGGDDYLPNFCSLCHVDLFKYIGLFKEFPLAGCESHEFAKRMQKNGFSQAVVGSSFVHHDGLGTTSKLPEKMKEILRKTHNDYHEEINLNKTHVNTIG